MDIECQGSNPRKRLLGCLRMATDCLLWIWVMAHLYSMIREGLPQLKVETSNLNQIIQRAQSKKKKIVNLLKT